MATDVERQAVPEATGEIPVVATPASEMSAAPAAQATMPGVEPPASIQAAAPIPSSAALPPAMPPEVQEYISRLEEQTRYAREQNERQVLDQVVAQYAQQLEQQYGLTADIAQTFARQRGDELYRQYNTDQLQRGKVRAALAIAKEYNVDATQLLDLPNPLAMRQTAATLSATTKQSTEIAQLRAQVERLTKGTVPAQNFSQGAQPGPGAALASDALESAWLKHERENPDRPNPYDNAYRAMVNR